MDNQNRRADDKRAPGQLQWGESVGAALAGAGFTGTIAAAPVLVPDIVMHGLRITKDGITYNGQEVKDAGVVHAALMDVLSGKPLPSAAPSAASIEGLTRYDVEMFMLGERYFFPSPTGRWAEFADVERLLATQSAKQGAQPAVNGIAATDFHDEGAIARCSYCGRYSLDPKTLGDRQPFCECGKQHGWCGSFKKPGADALWSGKAPTASQAAPEQAAHVQADVRDQALEEAASICEWVSTNSLGHAARRIRELKSKRAASTDGEASHG